MKQFKVLCAIFALVLGLSSVKSSATTFFATQFYSYTGGDISLRTSWNVSTLGEQNCPATTGTICNIHAIAGSGGHPDATNFATLRDNSSTFTAAYVIPTTTQKVEVKTPL